MTSMLHETNIQDWCIQQQQKNQHGCFYWPITLKDGKAARVQIGEVPLRVPFGPSSYSEGSRLNIDISIKDPDMLAWFEKLDNFVVDHVFENLQVFFPKLQLTKETLRDFYCPVMNQKADYAHTIRTKINSSAIVFEMDDPGLRKKASVEDITAGVEVIPVVSFDRVWVMGNRFGLTCVSQALCMWRRKERSLDEIFSFSQHPISSSA